MLHGQFVEDLCNDELHGDLLHVIFTNQYLMAKVFHGCTIYDTIRAKMNSRTGRSRKSGSSLLRTHWTQPWVKRRCVYLDYLRFRQSSAFTRSFSMSLGRICSTVLKYRLQKSDVDMPYRSAIFWIACRLLDSSGKQWFGQVRPSG